MSAREYALTWSETSRPGVLNQSDESCHRTEEWKRRRTTACWKNASHVQVHPWKTSSKSVKAKYGTLQANTHTCSRTPDGCGRNPGYLRRSHADTGGACKPHTERPRRGLRSPRPSSCACWAPAAQSAPLNVFHELGFLKKELGNDSIYKAPIIFISRYNTFIFLVYFQQ